MVSLSCYLLIYLECSVLLSLASVASLLFQTKLFGTICHALLLLLLCGVLACGDWTELASCFYNPLVPFVDTNFESLNNTMTRDF